MERLKIELERKRKRNGERRRETGREKKERGRERGGKRRAAVRQTGEETQRKEIEIHYLNVLEVRSI